MRQFGELLGHYRTLAGLSCNGLAHAVGVDPSYVSRLERLERDPPRRPLVVAIAHALDLPAEQADGLLASAGYAPDCLIETMERLASNSDPAVLAVLNVLQDDRLSPQGHQTFRQTIISLCEHWRPAGLAEYRSRPITVEEAPRTVATAGEPEQVAPRQRAAAE